MYDHVLVFVWVRKGGWYNVYVRCTAVCTDSTFHGTSSIYTKTPRTGLKDGLFDEGERENAYLHVCIPCIHTSIRGEITTRPPQSPKPQFSWGAPWALEALHPAFLFFFFKSALKFVEWGVLPCLLCLQIHRMHTR